jgi:hypothetical protein
LRKELEHALGASGKFRVITRSRLADFQLEGKFQDSGMLEPGTKVKSIAIEGVKGIVRGTFHYQHPKLTVFAELAMLDGGEVRTSRMEMPVDEAGARFWPDKSQDEAQAARVLKPQNIKQSQENLADVTNRLKRVPCEFGLQVVVADGRRDFAEGETMVYRVLAEQDCYVAMLCHQSDGSTVMLFPNAWCTGTAVAAGKVVEIPGTRKAGFEFVAGPPYGADVVQVIACTQRSSLHAMLEKQVAAAPEGTPYCGLARGIVVKGVEKAMDEAPGAGSGAAVRWSEAHVVVCTYPK